MENNYLIIFCYYFVISLSIVAILLFIVLNIKASFCLVEELVGYPFIEKYFPASKNGVRALYPVILFGLTVFTLLIIDYASLKWNEKLRIPYAEEISEMEKQTTELFDKHLRIPPKAACENTAAYPSPCKNISRRLKEF